MPGIEGQRRARALQRCFELTIEEVPRASGDMPLDGANALLVGFERAYGIGRLSQQCFQAVGARLDGPDFLEECGGLARMLLDETGAGRFEAVRDPGSPLRPVRLHRPEIGQRLVDNVDARRELFETLDGAGLVPGDELDASHLHGMPGFAGERLLTSAFIDGRLRLLSQRPRHLERGVVGQRLARRAHRRLEGAGVERLAGPGQGGMRHLAPLTQAGLLPSGLLELALERQRQGGSRVDRQGLAKRGLGGGQIAAAQTLPTVGHPLQDLAGVDRVPHPLDEVHRPRLVRVEDQRLLCGVECIVELPGVERGARGIHVQLDLRRPAPGQTVAIAARWRG